jgi:PAT family beta-lactamase induction signal transducer AmpG
VYDGDVPSSRIPILALLGFSSGLPFLLTTETMVAWLADLEIDPATIGAASLIALPYTLKFVWAPLLDRYRLPFLGRRRGWMLVFQISLIAAIAAMAMVDPLQTPVGFAAAAVAVAFLSASQDIVIDAYKTDVLEPHERVAGAAAAVTGYRAAMVTSGALALALRDHTSWQNVYLVLAGTMAIGIVATLVADEPPVPAGEPPGVIESLARPLIDLLRRPRVVAIIAFVALYAVGDRLAKTVAVAYLQDGEDGAGFTFTEIATLYHLLGLAGTIAGGVIAGMLVTRWPLRRALIVFGIAQAAANVLYIAVDGNPSVPLLAVAVTADNLANALGTAAFVAYLIGLCDRRFSATQYALLTSLSSLLGRLFGFAAGAAGDYSWPLLWIGTAAIAVPGIVLALVIPIHDDRV